MHLKAGDWASRLGFGPQGWDLDLQAGIWASRLGFGLRGGGGRVRRRRRRRRRRKNFCICESIGHWPLWGRCPKGGGADFNLGVEGLTEDMEDLLSLGLKFVPVQRVKKSKVEADVERLKVKLMWDVY